MTREILNEEEHNDLMNIIGMIDRELGEPPTQRPKNFGITVKEYVQKKGCSEGIARKFLSDMVDRGIFKKKTMIDGRGNTPMVYYPADMME